MAGMVERAFPARPRGGLLLAAERATGAPFERVAYPGAQLRMGRRHLGSAVADLQIRPDREMIRGAARGRAVMGAARQDFEVGRDHDLVELRDRAAGVEASAARREQVMRGEIAQAAAAACSFVRAPSSRNGTIKRLGDMARSPRLRRRPQARKILCNPTMRSRAPAKATISNRAARLQRRQGTGGRSIPHMDFTRELDSVRRVCRPVVQRDRL